VSYAVLPRCSTGGGGLSQLAQLTVSTSHELIEAATDPQPDTEPAYQLTDTNHIGWAVVFGSEVGDMCELDSNAAYLPTGFPWIVQRSWSNRAAAMGANPCVPASSDAYFYAAPLVADTTIIDITGTPQTVASVHVSSSGTVTIPVQLFASAG